MSVRKAGFRYILLNYSKMGIKIVLQKQLPVIREVVVIDNITFLILCKPYFIRHSVSDTNLCQDVLRVGGLLFDFTPDICHVHS